MTGMLRRSMEWDASASRLLDRGLRNGELMTEECGAHAGSKPQESRT
jgi:hypothetical protein